MMTLCKINGKKVQQGKIRYLLRAPNDERQFALFRLRTGSSREDLVICCLHQVAGGSLEPLEDKLVQKINGEGSAG